MLESSVYVLRPHYVNPNLQFRLACMLEKPIENFAVEACSVIVCLDLSSTAQILTCDEKFTQIQKTTVIKNIDSLKEIRVKYNSADDTATMVYRSKERVYFYKGPLLTEAESEAARSTLKREPISVPFRESALIIDISDFCQTVSYGILCVITTNTGKTYLLQYYNHKLGLFETSPTNKINSFLKLVMAPLFSQRVYSKASSCLVFSAGSEKGSLISLLDHQISRKMFNLSAGTNEHQSWQQNIKQHIAQNSLVLAHKFWTFESATFITVVCLVQNRISLHNFEIGASQKFGAVESIDNLFEMLSEAPQQQQWQEMEPEGETIFNIKSDLIEIEQSRGKIFVVCHRLMYHQHINSNKRAHFLAIVEFTGTKLTLVQATQLNAYGEFKLIKISSPQSFLLLLVGKSACYEILENEGAKIGGEQELSVSSQVNPSENSERRRAIPNIPSYESKRAEGLTQRNSTNLNSSGLTENPFSSVKIQKHLSHRDFPQLFRLLNLEKNQFRLKSMLEDISIANKTVSDYLASLILLRLFTVQNGLNYSLNIELISETFNSQKFEDSADQQQWFLREVFINKSFQAMLQIFKSFKDSRRYSLLYSMCVETIYNCVKTISAFLTENGSKLDSQQDGRPLGQKLTWVVGGVAGRYLPFFEELIIFLQRKYFETTQFHSTGAGDPQVRNRKQASQYEQKQLLDKYMEIKTCCGLSELKRGDNSEGQNNSTFRQIISTYIEKSASFNRFLASMAAKHASFIILDCLIGSRAVTKQDITEFVSQPFFEHQRSAVLLIFKNLINAEIGNIERPHPGRKEDNGLLVLDWVPATLQGQIYTFLITTYPKIGILYGLKTRSRKEVAASVDAILQSKSPTFFNTTTDPRTILNLVECLYDCSESVQLKANIDLARMFNKAKQKYQSYALLKASNQNWQMESQSWAELYAAIRPYMRQELIRQLESKFIIS